MTSTSGTDTSRAPDAAPATVEDRIRAVLRDRSPDAAEIVALTRTPATWVVGRDRLLLEHVVMPRFDWPTKAGVSGLQLADRRGRAVGPALAPGAGWRDYFPAGMDFVGIPPPFASGSPVLVTDDGLVDLRTVPQKGAVPTDDVRVARGWVLDRDARTLYRSPLDGCRTDSIRADLGGRIWCLAPGKHDVLWSDDGGSSWTRQRLSDSYFEWCDGGTYGADLQVLGPTVAIGLWRADWSLDRGRTWRDVELPFRSMRRGPPNGMDCPVVTPLRDGRLVMTYFGHAAAVDSTNTAFEPVRTPPGLQFAGVSEGLMTAASNKAYGARRVSYDGGRTWRPIEPRALARHLFDQR